MNVRELIAVLSTVDQDLPIACHVFDHLYMSRYDRSSHGSLAVYLLGTHDGDYIGIGNAVWGRHANPAIVDQNWRVKEKLAK